MSDQRDTARSERRYDAIHGARGDPAAGQATWRTCSTTASPGPNGPLTVLRVEGEVDLTTIDLLHTALDSELAQRPAHLIVDLAALSFCSARGLSVLSHAGELALAHGTGYAVAGVSPRLNRVWAMGWTAAERPRGFATVAVAVLAAMARQVGPQGRARWEAKHLIAVSTRPGGWDAAEPLVPVLAPVAGSSVTVS